MPFYERCFHPVPEYDVANRLRDHSRTYLAWKAIVADIDDNKMNLDLFQAKQARRHLESADRAWRCYNQAAFTIELHMEAALEFGATVEEVFEVMPIALLMDGAPVLSQIPHLVNALENAKRSVVA